MAGKQRVIIPRGIVNPNETTIVEIPANFRNAGTVVAKRKGIQNLSQYSYPSSDAGGFPSQSPSPTTKKRTYMRRTFPGTKHVDMDMSGKALSYGGRPYEDPADESSHGFHPYYPKEPFSPEMSYDCFNPPAVSTMGDLSYEEGSLYRDFRPARVSSPIKRANSPGCRPPSMDSYSSQSRSPARIVHKTSTTRTTPEEISQEEVTEESYSYSQESEPISSSGGGGGGSYPPEAYCTLDQSVSYMPYEPPGGTSRPASPGVSGMSSRSPGSAGCGSGSPCGTASGGASLSGASSSGATPQDLMTSLGHLESSEMQKIMGDLQTYQNARRRLLFDASSLASAADVSANILNTTA